MSENVISLNVGKVEKNDSVPKSVQKSNRYVSGPYPTYLPTFTKTVHDVLRNLVDRQTNKPTKVKTLPLSSAEVTVVSQRTRALVKFGQRLASFTSENY